MTCLSVFLFSFLAPGLGRFSDGSFNYRTHFCNCRDDVITDTINESEAIFERVFRHTFCPGRGRMKRVPNLSSI